MSLPDQAFPYNIAPGDELLIRAKVVLTHKYRPGDPGLLVRFGPNAECDIPLSAAFGVLTSINGEKP